MLYRCRWFFFSTLETIRSLSSTPIEGRPRLSSLVSHFVLSSNHAQVIQEKQLGCLAKTILADMLTRTGLMSELANRRTKTPATIVANS